MADVATVMYIRFDPAGTRDKASLPWDNVPFTPPLRSPETQLRLGRI